MKRNKKIKKPQPPKVHFIGAGGIGMSALAQYYLSEGWLVTGSDSSRSEITDDLKKRGVKIEIGHKRSNIQHPNLVIYSAAVPEDNPERLSAVKKKIETLSYAQALGELTKRYTTIAVSGSHGKSTTAAMLAIVLIRAGFDPTVIIGTKPKQIKGNFRKGKSEWLVIEADEYNRSFYNYHPDIAIITNIDKEHLDTYKTYKGVISGFSRFAKKVAPDGFIVANGNDKGVKEAVKGTKAKIKWYNKKPVPRRKLLVPGAHNQENAEAVSILARQLGITKKLTEKTLRDFKGAWRRLEKLRPRKNNINADLYTDYAHHPTEVKVTLEALSSHYPNKKIICVFQPHQNDRFNRLFDDFRKVFGGADLTMILPVYAVEGREGSAEKSSGDLVEAIAEQNTLYIQDVSEAFFSIEMFTDERPVVVFMSAGDLDAQLRGHFGLK